MALFVCLILVVVVLGLALEHPVITVVVSFSLVALVRWIRVKTGYYTAKEKAARDSTPKWG